MNEMAVITMCRGSLALVQAGERFSDVDEFDAEVLSRVGPLHWLTGGAWSLISLAYFAFMVWMVLECARSDPDRWLWIWVIVVFQPFGAFIYFFVRWNATHEVRLPKSMRRWARSREIKRLETAARQIGNAHQYVQLGDALRETNQFDRAGQAYAEALRKESKNVQALWGGALVEMQHKRFADARTRLATVLEIDPQYKFGDVSLEYGKALIELNDQPAAIEHLRQHVRRWRHPEAMYLLASLQLNAGDSNTAGETLDAMLLDIDGCPRAIARKYKIWKSKARKLQRKLNHSSSAA